MSETKQPAPALVRHQGSAVVPLIERTSQAVSPTAIPNAVSEIMRGVEAAVTAMDADDIDISMEAHQEGDGRSSAKFRLRAYRRRSGADE